MKQPLVLDIETTWVMNGNRRYPLPFDDRNKLVTVQWRFADGTKGIVVINHTEYTSKGNERQIIQDVLDKANLIIGHNLKFDIIWLKECGFVVSVPLYDTMISEYIRSKGLKLDLSLAGSAVRRGATPKLDILSRYMDKGINTDEIPLVELTEYAMGDCETTWQLYEWQIANPVPSFKPVEELMNELLAVLIDMERDGTYIDTDRLTEIEREYEEEYARLELKLGEHVRSVMGDKPYNLNSGIQLCEVIYSRKVTDKAGWNRRFNIGAELRNSVWKKKRPARLTKNEFVNYVKENTTKVFRTDRVSCDTCGGKGNLFRRKKDGNNYSKATRCPVCHGEGCSYVSTDKVAGFKVTPKDVSYISSGGFSTNKKILASLMTAPLVNDTARVFLKDYMRYGAIGSYLTSFIDGIKNNIKGNILHVNFNQCVTATGRLSSSNPNFQNLPRDKTFPIRKTVKSRWAGGSIIDCDLAQLEFRVAAILSGDKVAKADILAGVDVHNFTSKVLTDAGQPTDRQNAKSHTFKPLYGGLSGTQAEVAYYTAFLDKYHRIRDWHTELSETAIRDKQISSPSGRTYAFPDAKRQSNNKSSQFTQIVNYCVQGFATGDITPCIIIEMAKEIKEQGLKSKLILTVHDSVTADCYPGEEELMIRLFKKVFDKVPELLYNRFSIKIDIPIGYDLSIGSNWSEKKKVA